MAEGPVPTLHEHIRFHRLDESQGRVLPEEHDGVHGGQGAEDLRPLLLRNYRSTGAFEAADARVGVKAHHEVIPEGARGVEVAHMADMEEVEASVGEDDDLTDGTPVCPQGHEAGPIHGGVRGHLPNRRDWTRC